MGSQHVIHDETYGEIVGNLDDDQMKGLVSVSGTSIPTVLIRREGIVWRATVPIGARSSDRLRVTIGDEPVHLILGSGRISRRSHRIAWQWDGEEYSIVPTATSVSCVRRGREPIGELKESGRSFSCEWSNVPPADSAALVYACAIGFGVGAAPAIMSIVSGFFNSLPW